MMPNDSLGTDSPIDLPGTRAPGTPWDLYNTLIDAIPEDVLVTGWCLGVHWSYVEAECGMGVAWTASGGAPAAFHGDLRGRRLREVAELSKSWNFREATLGVAALNAWYARRELLDPLGALYDDPVDLPDGTVRKMDAFGVFRDEMPGKKVVVVGHFPHLERISSIADLTILERNVQSDDDVPDPACEYVMPLADFAFITGVTFINKTAPRLIELARNARLTFVGPSVVMAPVLFERGIDVLAGSIVADPEKTRLAVQTGLGMFFGEALQMTVLRTRA